MSSLPNIYLGLVHFPIRDKMGKIVTTSVTNMDLHDISRSCRTYGFKKYFVITPIEKQHQHLSTILSFWETDTAYQYNPDRSSALGLIQIAPSIEWAQQAVLEKEGQSPYIVVTGANLKHNIHTEESVITQIALDRKPLLLLFGTGFGLTDSVVEAADFCLPPLKGMAQDAYNHLSVRSAVAIYCERLKNAIQGHWRD